MYGIRTSASNSAIDQWQDTWSLFNILANNAMYIASDGTQFDVLSDEGKAEAMRHELSLTNEDMHEGHARRLVQMNEHGKYNLSAPHWGTHEDTSSLERMLNVGIFVLWKNRAHVRGRALRSRNR